MRKRQSPEITTMCYCEDCGEATRASYHLDLDCKTIQRLKTTISDLQHRLEVAEQTMPETRNRT